jgi:hypothetical protein
MPRWSGSTERRIHRHLPSVDPDALLARKSNAHPAQPSDRGHVLMDNRHALIVDYKVTQAVGTGERDAAQTMAADRPVPTRTTTPGDLSPRCAASASHPTWRRTPARSGSSAIDGRTTRHEGYAKSINARRGIEKVFGWIKQWGGPQQFKLRGAVQVSAVFGLHVIAYNLIRLGNLLRPAMEAA